MPSRAFDCPSVFPRQRLSFYAFDSSHSSRKFCRKRKWVVRPFKVQAVAATGISSSEASSSSTADTNSTAINRTLQGPSREIVRIADNSPTDCPSSIASFIEWLEDHGVDVITVEFTSGHRTIGNSPDRQRGVTATSNSFTDFTDPLLLTPLLSHDGVQRILTIGEFIIVHRMTHNSPVRQRELTDMSNSLPNYAASIQSQYYQRQAASLNDGVVIDFPSDGDDGEFPSMFQTIIAQARATKDKIAAGHSKFFAVLVPATLTIAYQGRGNLVPIHNNALSAEILGYFTVGIAGVSVISSLAGLSLSTLKPNTLPFGYDPIHMMQFVRDVSAHTTANAFIGTMCHGFLQDNPIIMWTVAGLASAGFMGLMTFIGWRRG